MSVTLNDKVAGTSVSAVGVANIADPRLIKVTPRQTLGTRLVDHIGANSLIDANSSFITGSKTSMRNAAPVDFSRQNNSSNQLKMVATGADISINATTLFSISGTLTPILDRNISSIGFFAKAMPRADGEPFGSLLVRLGSKAAANNGLNTATAGTPYYDYKFAIPADGKERFYVLEPSSASVINAPADGLGNFDHNINLEGIMFRLPYSGDCCKVMRNVANSKYWGAGDTVYIGEVFYNPMGLAKAYIRFDDNIADIYYGTYKDIVNPSAVLDYCPHLTSASYPDANNRAFANDGYGAGYAFKGKSGVNILNNEDLSIAELIKRFGFTATTYILCRTIGQPNFLTVDQLKKLRDNYGWLVAFQTYNNPVDMFQEGAMLLGPRGYNKVGTKFTSDALAATPGITAIETNSGAPTMRVINCGIAQASAGSGQSLSAQGYPMVFEASPDLPSALTAGVVYWANVKSSSTPDAHTTQQNISLHATEIDAGNGTNPIDIVTGYVGTASNIVFRYYQSTNDYTGILADFVAGKNWFIQNGFGDGYKTWAPNQGGIDKYVEQAIDAFGEFKYIHNGGGAKPNVEVTFSTPMVQYGQVTMSYSMPDREFITRDAMLATSNVPTDNTSYPMSCTISAATDIVTLSSVPAGFYAQDGEQVYFTALTGGAGLTAARGSVYFIRDSTGSTFKLAATKGGAAINVTTDATAGSIQVQETSIRAQVRHYVFNGCIFSSITHGIGGVLSIRELVYFMDECRYWVNKGLLVVDNADVIGEMVMSERL